LIDGMEATDHEAQTNFQKKTQDHEIRLAPARSRTRQAKSIGVAKLAPHDLRRTCARLCHASGGKLEQIQFLLGPDSGGI
jgi:integrase